MCLELPDPVFSSVNSFVLYHIAHNLLGHHTTVYTDHSASVSVLSTVRPSGKIVQRALTIQGLNLTFRHWAGKLNCNADALSCNPTSTGGGEC